MPVPLAVAAFTANFDRFAVGPILVTIAAIAGLVSAVVPGMGC